MKKQDFGQGTKVGKKLGKPFYIFNYKSRGLGDLRIKNKIKIK